MNKIRVMDSHLANMIAAGEVVERPSGIVKELVENSIDAGATEVSIYIEEGGMSSIKVVDNGEGMSKDDLRQAFMRHSTSKIYDPSDLNRIRSFGFRGEALPSIASVSYVEATTHNGNQGYKIVINNSVEEEFGVIARNKGTTLEVKQLFSRLPARLKYIKNPRYEAAIVLDIVQKFAAAHPSISFSYYSDDKLSFRTFGNGSLKDVFYQVFGSSVAVNLIEISNNNFDYEIKATLAQPQHTRSNRQGLWVYVNNRMVRSSVIQNAIVEGYRRHIPKDRFPIGILKIEVDPQLVDVNVHPSKWEIRLSKEKELKSLIIDSVESSLTQKFKAPRIEIVKPEQETILEELLQAQSDAYIKESFKTDSREIDQEVIVPKAVDTYVSSLGEVKQDLIPKEIDTYVEEDIVKETIEPESFSIESLVVLAQMSGQYILAQGETGLYIIDQHAAMERIRYEYFQNKLLETKSVLRPLLFPIILEGRGSLVVRENDVKKAFKQFQLDVEVLDSDSFVLREHPVWMKENEISEFCNKILDYLEANRSIREEDFRSHALATLACHSSVRFNEYLSMEEMQQLVEDLRRTKQGNHCPHGRPTYMIVDHDMLWKGFMR